MKTMLRPLLIAAALLLPALAGCSRKEPEAPVALNEADTTPVEIAPVETPAPAPAPPPTETPTPSPAETPIAADEQMMDDAAATGMTARSQREEDTADTGSETENVETK